MKLRNTFIVNSKHRGSFIRGVITLATGSAASQALIVLASPLLTRLYTPNDFGVLAVFSALLGVISVASCLRYELAIPLAKGNIAALNVIATALGLNTIVALGVTATLVPFSDEVAAWFSTPNLAAHLWLLPVGIVFAGLYRTLTFWSVRERAFGRLATTKLAQAVGGIATQIACGVLSPDPFGLIFGQVVGQSAGAISLARNLQRRAAKLKYRLRTRRLAAAAKRYIRFPKFDLPAASMNTLAANLPQFLLALLFNPAIAGLYLLAHRVIGMPVAILGQAVGQGLYAHSREAIAAGYLHSFVLKVATALLALITAPLLVLFAFGENLFGALFGPDWRIAGTYASWLILGASAQFVYSPISLMLQATNAQHINLALQLLMLVSRTAALSFGYFASDALTAIIALAIADMCCYALGTLLTLRQVRKHGASKAPSE